MNRLENKVALITGGSSGLGQATALLFAREGAKVVIANHGVEGGEKTVNKIKETGGEAIFIKTDVSKAAYENYGYWWNKLYRPTCSA